LLIGGLAVLFVVLRRRNRLGAEHFEPEVIDTTNEGVTT
jgi:hypothetical protein